MDVSMLSGGHVGPTLLLSASHGRTARRRAGARRDHGRPRPLGDLGADVIKVESPEGDTTRRLGPARNPGMGAFFLACNRNKRSVVLDLKQPSGRAALLKLAAGADVMLHNFRPAPAARLGLDYEAFRAVNPRLVYVATYGFRPRGPYGEKPAYDDVIQAASGL